MARPRLDQPNYRLTRRGDRYYVRWWQGDRWQRVSTGTTVLADARRWLAQFVAGRGTPEPPAAPVVAAIMDAYIKDRRDKVRSIATLEAAKKALVRHLGDLEPDHITRERIRFYARQRRNEGHMVGPADARRKKITADGTIARELVTLRAALRWAVAERWIAAAPHIDVPAAAPPRDRWLTREEAAKVLDAAQAPHIKVFIALALYTAARSGALLALRWQSVDLDRGLIDLGAGQGNKGRAVVPIAAALAPILAQAREMATCDYVVEHGGEGVASVKTGIRAAARRAGVPGVTPHVFRHTSATWMAQGGVDMDMIARYLGHRSTTTTAKHYAKWSPDYLRVAAEALSGATGAGNVRRI